MKDKKFALYLRRLYSHLNTIYAEISRNLPDEERFSTLQKQLKPEIQAEYLAWKKEHPLALPDIFKKHPFDKEENYEVIEVLGRIKAIEPLYDMICELAEDIEIASEQIAEGDEK